MIVRDVFISFWVTFVPNVLDTKKHTIIVVLCSDMIVCCDASVEGISYFEWWFRGALI